MAEAMSLYLAMEFASSLAKSNIVFETDAKLVKKKIFPHLGEALFVTVTIIIIIPLLVLSQT